MDEKVALKQELIEIAKKKSGELTETQKAQIADFAETFLALLDDTDK